MKKINFKLLYAKSTLLVFAVLYSITAVVGSTYSWVTSSNQLPNEFTGELGLRAMIVEDFEQQKYWQPDSSIDKVVSVYNEGRSPGFARISFEEIVKTISRSDVSQPSINAQDEGVKPEFCSISKWEDWENAEDVFDDVSFFESMSTLTAPEDIVVKVKTSVHGLHRYQYAIYQEQDDGHAFRRVTAQFAAEGDSLEVHNLRYWGFPSAEAEQEAAWGLVNKTSLLQADPPAADRVEHLVCDSGEKISIVYSHLIKELTGAAADQGKWYYNSSDGFFYYIGVIAPGEVSNTLMTELALAADADISYSGMDLQFIVNMQALQVNTEALVSDWGLSKTDDLYSVLAYFCAA